MDDAADQCQGKQQRQDDHRPEGDPQDRGCAVAVGRQPLGREVRLGQGRGVAGDARGDRGQPVRPVGAEPGVTGDQPLAERSHGQVILANDE
jgi:hypothetical protein